MAIAGTNSEPSWFTVRSAEAMVDVALDLVRQALPRHGPFSLALSGGTTPGPLYERLNELSVEWGQGLVMPVGERWVPLDHADSNEAMIRRTLLRGEAAKVGFVGLWSAANDVEQAAVVADKALAQHRAPFDLVVAGMGEDGHTASLLPGAPGLEAAIHPYNIRSVVALAPPNAPYLRLTMTRARLLKARRVLLLIGGPDKRRIIEAAMRTPDERRWPVSILFAPGSPPVDVIWNNI